MEASPWSDDDADVHLPPVHHASSLSLAFAQRSTCRDLSTSPLSREDIAGVLAGAGREDTGWAYPSAHDRRPVGVSVLVPVPGEGHRRSYAFDPSSRCLRRRGVTREQPLSSIAYDEQPWLDSAPLVISLEADLGPVSVEFESQDESGLRGRDFVMLEAGALAQSLLLGTAAAGLGAVLVGGIRQQPCRDLLRTPRHVCSLIAVGHTTGRGSGR